jgi:hypothetical protein
MIFPVWTFQSVKSIFGMDDDQRVIIRFLWNEGADASNIAIELQAQLSENGYQLRTVQLWIMEIRLGHQDLHDEICIGRPARADLGVRILAILDESPFKSASSIAEILLIAHPTVIGHLHSSIGFKSVHLHWTPHLLTDDFREKRKDVARATSPFLRAPERDGWRHFATGDQSWLVFNTSPNCTWTRPTDDTVAKLRLDIPSKNSCLHLYGIRTASMCSIDSQMILK